MGGRRACMPGPDSPVERLGGAKQAATAGAATAELFHTLTN
jgi:hypothetical protein